jgi:aspartate ammonia-lyase
MTRAKSRAYGRQVALATAAVDSAGEGLLELALGGTAVGTGLNAHPEFAARVIAWLAERTGIPFRPAANRFEALGSKGACVTVSGALRGLAVALAKVANDLRWMASGPHGALAEIRLPALQPGSSIMPGKVNPVVPEVVSQICFQIIGNDVTVSMAAEASELELNMAEPIIAFNLFFGLTLLRNAAIVLASRCIAGIEPNRERCREYVQNSIGLVTALNPVLGYEKSAAIAKEALKTGASVYDLVIAKGWLTKEKLDEMLKPENMTHPRKL